MADSTAGNAHEKAVVEDEHRTLSDIFSVLANKMWHQRSPLAVSAAAPPANGTHGPDSAWREGQGSFNSRLRKQGKDRVSPDGGIAQEPRGMHGQEHGSHSQQEDSGGGFGQSDGKKEPKELFGVSKIWNAWPRAWFTLAAGGLRRRIW